MEPKQGGFIEKLIKQEARADTCLQCAGYIEIKPGELYGCMIHDKVHLPVYSPYRRCEKFVPLQKD